MEASIYFTHHSHVHQLEQMKGQLGPWRQNLCHDPGCCRQKQARKTAVKSMCLGGKKQQVIVRLRWVCRLQMGWDSAPWCWSQCYLPVQQSSHQTCRRVCGQASGGWSWKLIGCECAGCAEIFQLIRKRCSDCLHLSLFPRCHSALSGRIHPTDFSPSFLWAAPCLLPYQYLHPGFHSYQSVHLQADVGVDLWSLRYCFLYPTVSHEIEPDGGGCSLQMRNMAPELLHLLSS